MFDLVKLSIQSGDGGNGKVSFRREKFIPKGGPDGGNGGNGGSIYIVGNRHMNTLQHYAGVKKFEAKRGQDGGSENQIGHKGEDLTLEVPVGTTIWLLAENETARKHRIHRAYEGNQNLRDQPQKYYLDRPSGNPPLREPDEPQPVDMLRNASLPLPSETSQPSQDHIAELQEQILRSPSLKNINVRRLPKLKVVEITEDGQKFLLAQGGTSGRGNVMFKASDNTTPFEAEYGTFGEKKVVLFELRLLADVGLIGYPNAGKSTLLSVVTKANPKVANYPFTTIEPNLGVMSAHSLVTGRETRDIVIADLPGIIEGASEGKGLGFDFLRHVQGCKVLLYMLSLEEPTLFDQHLNDEEKAELLYKQYQLLYKEMKEFDLSLLEKKILVSISKKDLYPQTLIEKVKLVFQKHGIELFFFSTLTHENIDQLQHILGETVLAADKAE
jgi:GTPase